VSPSWTPGFSGHDQNLASPFLVGLMTHLAELGADDVVFETGTGAGYHAAVLSRVAAQVYSVEVVGALARQAAETLEELKVGTAHVREGDGYYGWPEHGPYDAIIVKEAVDHLPAPLLNQLKPGGRLVVPLSAGGAEQFLTVVRKTADGAFRRCRAASGHKGTLPLAREGRVQVRAVLLRARGRAGGSGKSPTGPYFHLGCEAGRNGAAGLTLGHVWALAAAQLPSCFVCSALVSAASAR
jgi:protein-L-isoaspartate O-methyltransferase